MDDDAPEEGVLAQVVLVRADGQALDESVEEEREQNPRGDGFLLEMFGVAVAVLDALGKGFQNDLDEKTAHYPKAEGVAVGFVNLWQQMEYGDAEQIRTGKGEQKLDGKMAVAAQKISEQTAEGDGKKEKEEGHCCLR